VNSKLHSKAIFRPATREDLPGMMAILNREIETGVNCFRTRPMREADREKWWRARENGRYPAWVASCENRICGWSSLSRWSAYEAYEATVEISIWIDQEVQRRGIGSKLFRLAIDHAREHGVRVILSRVESQNVASLALHDRFGFTTVGVMHRVGEKFGQLLDVTILELQVGE
jgi:phosphinothricin acetyltransferase